MSTGSFLFYAKSAKSGSKFEAGSLIAANLTNDNPSNFTFDLEQIITDATAPTVESANGGKLIAYLTSVATASDGTKKWCEYTDADNAAMKAMFDTYSSKHGLSSFEVERVLTDLNKSLKPLTSPIATAIKTAIDNATYATVNASDEVELIAALDQFPQEFNLPVGSVDIKWNASAQKFENCDYVGMAALNTYTYPAQLWYYVNSTIQTSNTSKKTMYDNTNDWNTILDAHTDAVSVNTKTRAVAIKDPIQYAVARLDVAVKLSNASMADNSESAEGIATAVDCSAGFPVTAILVGGQRQVKFDFTAQTTGTEYTVYDNVMNTNTMKAMPGTDYSDYNYTLLLENGTQDVMMAVEMQNTTTKDFYGVGNQLIPAGGKFYVVAKLTAALATETSGHVFKQDYTTTAKLNLTDLKKAYNTIPDLRTPQLELGFSVDLTWQSGHTYTIDFE